MLASGSITSRCCSTAIVCEKYPSRLPFNYEEQLDTWHKPLIERQPRFWSNFWAFLTKPVPPSPSSPCTGFDSMTHHRISLSPDSTAAIKRVHACFWLQCRDGEHGSLWITWISWPRISSVLAMTESLIGELCYDTSICTPEGDWHKILASAHIWCGRWAQWRLMISSLFRYPGKRSAIQTGDMYSPSTGELLSVLQLSQSSPTPFGEGLLGSYTVPLPVALSVVTFLISENTDHLVLLMTAFCRSSATEKVLGLLMSAFLLTSEAGIKENHWSSTIPPLPKHLKDHTSGIRIPRADSSLEEPRVA